jgi:hypothetical protein
MTREREEFEAKMAEQKKLFEAKKKQDEALKTVPHLKNINSDPMLSGSSKIPMKKVLLVGR